MKIPPSMCEKSDSLDISESDGEEEGGTHQNEAINNGMQKQMTFIF